MEKINLHLRNVLSLIENGIYAPKNYSDIVKYLQFNNEYLNELEARIDSDPSQLTYENAFSLAAHLVSDQDYVASMSGMFSAFYDQSKTKGTPGKLSDIGEKITEMERENSQRDYCAPYLYLKIAFEEKIKVIIRASVVAKINLDRENLLLSKFRDA